MSEVPPVLLSAIVCDRVIFDRMTGMPSLINILQNLNAHKFPVRTAQVIFFCELTNGHGKTNLKVRLIDTEHEEAPLFEQAGTVEFKDVQQVVTFAMNLQGVMFPHQGQYRFQLLSDETLLGERRIICRQVEMKPKQQ